MLNYLSRWMAPGETVTKKGSVVRLKFLEGKRASVVIGGGALKAAGHVDTIAKHLTAGKFEVQWIDGVKGDPTTGSVMEVATALSEFKPDWVIACGGGAVLDAAKLAWVIYENPGLELTQIYKPHSPFIVRERACFLAIPTTSGTGSEASSVAVVIDEAEQRKVPVYSHQLMPDVSILDASLTLSLGRGITAATALDAFTHAFESYCSSMRHLMAEQIALAAGRAIRENLQRCLAEPEQLPFREQLQYASYLAGQAQNITSVGAIHAISHAFGVRYRLAHGHGNAIFLPAVATRNARGEQRVESFAFGCGFTGLAEMTQWIQEVLEQAELATGWQAAIGQEGSVDETLMDLIGKDVCLRTNPVKLDGEQLHDIIEESR
jgi:alcohol dehydrogenase class IV